MAIVGAPSAFQGGIRMYEYQLEKERQDEEKRLLRERQAMLDARQAEMDARTKTEWEQRQEDRSRAQQLLKDTDAEIGRQSELIGGNANREVEGVNKFLGGLTMAEAAGGGKEVQYTPDGAIVQVGQAKNPAMQPIQLPGTKSTERQLAEGALALARAQRNPQAMMAAGNALAALDRQEAIGALTQQALNMTPDMRQAIAERMTQNPGYKFKAKVDPATQITTLELEDGKRVDLTPAQFAQVLVGQYRATKGDMNGLADIEKIDKNLADRLRVDNEALKGFASANNTAVVTQNSVSDWMANAPVREAVVETAKLRAELAKLGDTPEDKERAKQIETRLLALGTGMRRAAGDQNAPMEVKLARAFVDAGMAPDMRIGLEMATTKKSQSAKDVYLDLMKPQNGLVPDEKSVSKVMETVYGPDWRSKLSGPASSTSQGGSKLQNVTDADIEATAKLYNMTPDQVRERLRLNKPAAAAAPAAGPAAPASAASAPSQFGSTEAERDRTAILSAELVKAKDAVVEARRRKDVAAEARANEDVKSLEREIARTPTPRR